MTEKKRQRVSSGTIWEAKAGYSRATRVGDLVQVSGTTATTRDGGFVGDGDAYAQTHQILSNIDWALQQLGSNLNDVVRLRIFVVRFEDWQAVAQAMGEVLGSIRPTTTLVGTPWLIEPRMLVEIDADAIVGSAAPID